MFQFIPRSNYPDHARPNPDAMAHREADLIQGLDPETQGTPSGAQNLLTAIQNLSRETGIPAWTIALLISDR